MNTGIKLHGHFDRHRSFLADAGLLGKLRTRHQSAWVVRLLKEEFGTFGLELAAAIAEIGQRLAKIAISSKNTSVCASIFFPDSSRSIDPSSSTKKEHPDEQATV
jgi:hypothetical protein